MASSRPHSDGNIQTSLDILRLELEELRAQDIKLLRELIYIRDTIRYLSTPCFSRRHRWASCRAISAPGTRARSSESPDVARRPRSTLIKRHQSDSNYWKSLHLDRMDSMSSSEGDLLGSLDELDLASDNDDGFIVSPSQSPKLEHCRHEESDRSPFYLPSVEQMDDSYYEEVLQRNVKLWKSYKTSTTI